MAKVSVLFLLLGLSTLLLSQQTVEAKPFFFNIFAPPNSGSNVRTETQTSVNIHFTSVLAEKLRFLTTLLQGGLNVNYNSNKACCSATTTTSKPSSSSSTTPDSVFIEDKTDSSSTVAKTTTTTTTTTTTVEPEVTSSESVDSGENLNPGPTNKPFKPATTKATTESSGYEYSTSTTPEPEGYDYKQSTTTTEKTGYEYTSTQKPGYNYEQSTTEKSGYEYTSTQKPGYNYEQSTTTQKAGYEYTSSNYAYLPPDMEKENEI